MRSSLLNHKKDRFIAAAAIAVTASFLNITGGVMAQSVPPDTLTTQETITTTQETTAGTQETTVTTQETAQSTQQTTETVQAVPEFSDVGLGDDYYTSVNYLREKGIVVGYSDGTFRPNQKVNRAEALKLIMETLSGPVTGNPEAMAFEDVTKTDWFYDYVEKGWNNYIVKGYPDGLFHPERTINRAESLKMAILQEGDSLPAVNERPYSDVPVDIWYAPYAEVSKLRSLFLESRSSGALNADEEMTRADFAELIYRMMKSKTGSDFGRATWYGSEGVNWGTASGEKFDTNKMAAAHKTLPFGTQIEVTNLANGKSVIVEINDRGPYASGMELDLTSGAFQSIASLGAGIITVEYKILTPEEVIQTNLTYGF